MICVGVGFRSVGGSGLISIGVLMIWVFFLFFGVDCRLWVAGDGGGGVKCV